MVTILYPLLVAVVGLVVYALSANPKVMDLAKAAWWVGLFFVVAAVSKEAFRW
jgi:hypothetical protein